MIYIIILLIIILILICPVEIIIELHNNNISVYIKLINIIKITIVNKKKLINFESLFQNEIEGRAEKFHLKRSEILEILKKINKFLKILLNIKIEFGFERRDLTALVYAGLVSVFPILKVYLENKFVEGFEYKLLPTFEKEFFDIKVQSSIKINIFKGILIIFILLKETLYIKRQYKSE